MKYNALLKFEMRGLVLNVLPSSMDLDHLAGHPAVEAFAEKWGVKPRGVAHAIIVQRSGVSID